MRSCDTCLNVHYLAPLKHFVDRSSLEQWFRWNPLQVIKRGEMACYQCQTCREACICLECAKRNKSNAFVCNKCETKTPWRFWNPKSTGKVVWTLLLLRERWKRERHPMGVLPRDFWVRVFSRRPPVRGPKPGPGPYH